MFQHQQWWNMSAKVCIYRCFLWCSLQPTLKAQNVLNWWQVRVHLLHHPSTPSHMQEGLQLRRAKWLAHAHLPLPLSCASCAQSSAPSWFSRQQSFSNSLCCISWTQMSSCFLVNLQSSNTSLDFCAASQNFKMFMYILWIFRHGGCHCMTTI